MINHNDRTYDFETSPGLLVLGENHYRLQSLGPATDSINNVPVTLFFVYVSDGLPAYVITKKNNGKVSFDRSYSTYRGTRIIVNQPWHIVEDPKKMLVQVDIQDVEEPEPFSDEEWDRLMMDAEVEEIPELAERLDMVSARE